MLATWWKESLLPLPPQQGENLVNILSSNALSSLNKSTVYTPLKLWQAIKNDWQTYFVLNHLFVHDTALDNTLSDKASDMDAVWEAAAMLAKTENSTTIEVRHIMGALMKTSQAFTNFLRQQKLSADDIDSIVLWLGRGARMIEEKPRDFGGIGRDWTHGYTPLLDRFGHNVSLEVERHGGHYGHLGNSETVKSIKNAFSQGSTAIALIGESGSGKTSHIYALAQVLLQEKKNKNLEHRQIISLNASMIISSASRPGELEQLVNLLLSEGARAGHIVLFFDNAELFFTSGTGAFDASTLLLPVVQSRAIQLIFAFNPKVWQTLRGSQPTLGGLIAPITIPEPSESQVMRILEDTALGLEGKHKLIITYDALREAYRLSGRYEQEIAYPGKAINLLEQSLAQAEQGVVTNVTIQKTIEQSRGVKVTSASAAESDSLLNLEDKIHERMINQSRAVSVVSSALRRARAGVSNPKRPTGSFLFLGPTGVGKTELAKAVSATYFGAEANMIRLDMSEYQQAEDVARLLSDGREESKSLISSVRQQPFGVVLLDEIEKAHPNILNLLLQLLDEGQLTDASGRVASFRDCVIIATSNAGANTIRERISAGEKVESLESVLTDELINSGQFKPELLNRFDEIVVFRPLDQTELLQVVALMLKEVNSTLATQNITLELTPEAAAKIVEVGYDPKLGARPMRRALQSAVEDTIANRILSGTTNPGDQITLDVQDLKL